MPNPCKTRLNHGIPGRFIITYVIRNTRSKNCLIVWTEPRLSLGLDNSVFSQSARCYRNTWFDLPPIHCQVIPPGEAIEIVSTYAVRGLNWGGLLHTEFAFSYDESNEKVKEFMSLNGTNTYGRQMYDIETNTDLLRISVWLPSRRQ